MAKKAKKDLSFVIRCSHCFEHDFRLDDVTPEEKIKYYTDTPMKNATPAGHRSTAGKLRESGKRESTGLKQNESTDQK